MKNRLIILLLPIKFREFDYNRYDFEDYERMQNYDVICHELIDYIYPGFSEVFTKESEKRNVKKFNSFENWTKEIQKLKKVYKDKILIINELTNHSFKSIKINLFLKKNGIKTLIYSHLDHPSQASINLKKNIFYLFFNLIKNRKKLYFVIQHRIFEFISSILKLKPDFFLKTGNISQNSEIQYPKIISGHSRDYNMYIKLKKDNYKVSNEKYGLFLDSCQPVHNKGDSYINGDMKGFRGTKENWLKSVNKFLKFIEIKLNLKIIIVPHPKINLNENYSKLYNGRLVSDKPLSILSKNASLIISRDSAGSCFATFNKIPLIFIYTNELKKIKIDNFLIHQKKFANFFGSEPINIDEEITDEKLKKLLKFEEKLYEKYIQQYSSSRNDNKPNYSIISELIS